jgi:transposase-like protein
VYPDHVKQQAVRMYCEGTGVQAISRVLNVKSGTAYSWIKKSPVGAEHRGTAEKHEELRTTSSGDLPR